MRSRNWFILLASVSVGLLFLAACGGTPQPTVSSGEAGEHQDTGEHQETGEQGGGQEMEEHAHVEVPDEYAGLASPFEGDQSAIEAGKTIYEASCATCHGTDGHGDGPAAEGLDPKPASFADADMMSGMSDAYLFWRVSEGGTFAPFNSVMPPWKNSLSEDQRWQVISYVRTFSGSQ